MAWPSLARRASRSPTMTRHTESGSFSVNWKLLLLQRQDRHHPDQLLHADGLRHVVLEPRTQHAGAVFGAGVGRQGGRGGGPAALRWERANLPDQPVTALPRHREVAQQ